jgi:hypothetical protein
LIIRVQNQSDISAVSQRISPKKHPNLRSWRVVIIRSRGEHLGTVAASDRDRAETDLEQEQRSRLLTGSSLRR